MNISKKALKKLIKEPYRLGTRDRYTQEGIVFLAEHILRHGKIILEVYESDSE